MASTINASNGATSGLIQTGDASGVLALQVNNGTTALTIDTSGNVGIGTTTPANPTGGKGLEVSNASGASFRITNSATYLDFQSGGSANYILSNGAYPLVFYTNGSERMRLDSAGNLGLGVTPSAWNTLKAIEQQNGVFWASYSGDADSYFGANAYYASGWFRKVGGYASYYRQTTGQHQWAVAASSTAGSAISFTQAMTLDASGNLLVGSTTQIWDEKALITNSGNNVVLGVYGTNASYTSSAIRCQIETAAGTGWYFFEGRSGGGTFQYGIRGNGTVTTSDERRKKNIEPARSYLEDICKIPVIKYNWKSDDDGAQKELGWIAQDVQKVFPSMVVTHHDGPNDDQEVLLLKKEVFLPMLMKCIQEQQAIIESLKARLDAANL